MASSYPAALDSTFPGWPYSDETEYLQAAFANGWVSALQSIEGAIGAGAGSSPLNPLYSQPFNQTFTTLTARIAALENWILTNFISIDPADGDIAPVAAVAEAGDTGKAADAGHAHVGVASFNSRVGSVVTQASDVTRGFTQAGQLFVGTGSGTGTLLNPGSSGQQLGTDGTTVSWGTGGSASGDLRFTSALSWDSSAWMSANGAAVSRSFFSGLFNACTIQFTAVVVAGVSGLSGLSPGVTSQMQIGMPIEGAGIPAGTTIGFVGGTSIGYNRGNTGSGPASITVFPYGNGNGSTTFNVIDMRGRSPVGVDWDRSGPDNDDQPWWWMGAFGGEMNHFLLEEELAEHFHQGGSEIEDNTHLHAGNTSDESILHGHIPPTGFGQFICTLGGGAYILPLFGSFSGGGLRCDYGRGVSGEFGEGVDTGFADQFHSHDYDTGFQDDNHSHPFITDGRGQGLGHNNMHPFVVGHWLLKI